MPLQAEGRWVEVYAPKGLRKRYLVDPSSLVKKGDYLYLNTKAANFDALGNQIEGSDYLNIRIEINCQDTTFRMTNTVRPNFIGKHNHWNFRTRDNPFPSFGQFACNKFNLANKPEKIKSRFSTIERLILAATSNAVLECRKSRDKFSDSEFLRIRKFIMKGQNFSEYEFSDPAANLYAQRIAPKLDEGCRANPKIMESIGKDFFSKYDIKLADIESTKKEDDIYRVHPKLDKESTKYLVRVYSSSKKPGEELKPKRNIETCREFPNDNERDCLTKVFQIDSDLRLAEITTYKKGSNNDYIARYLVDCSTKEILTVPLKKNSERWISVLEESSVADACLKFD